MSIFFKNFKLPDSPGCYIFKDRNSHVLYVGKARSLKKRVSSYFREYSNDAKILKLLEHIHSIDYIITSNEVEALMLESRLIKQHQPKYKDRKSVV